MAMTTPWWSMAWFTTSWFRIAVKCPPHGGGGLHVRLHARVLRGHVVHVGHDVSVVEHGVVHGVLVQGGRQVSTSHVSSVLPIEVMLEIF